MPRGHTSDLPELCEQAFELASPVPDYEEAAIQAGWNWDEHANEFRLNDKGDGHDGFVAIPLFENGQPNWELLCDDQEIESYDREVFEHWAVTDWFADKLIAAGEKVDKDFGNLCIWARTTTGQGIASDGVIERIYAETHK